MLVFWSYSVFGQNHLCVNVAANRDSTFQSEVRRISSSLSAIWTMCHPVRTPICLLIHTSERRVIQSGHQTDKHHLSGRRVSSVRTPTSYREASVQTWFVWMFQQYVRMPISSQTVHWFFPSSRKGRSINCPDDVVSHPDAYLRKARIAVQNEPSGHLTAVVRTMVHRIW
jgi:hypothetical protein